MPEHGLTAAKVAELGQELSASTGEQATLDHLLEFAVHMVPRCDFAGVSLRRPGGQVESPAVTDAVAAKVDALQYDLHEGPCLDSIWEDDTHVIDDLAADERWPGWGPLAVDLGVRAVLSVRMPGPQGAVGALNLYSGQPGPFDDDDLDSAHAIATQAGMVLWAKAEHVGLRTAMQTRHIIGMAQGILMARHGLTPENAFAVLRRYSSQHNVKLRAVAERVVREFGPVSPE